MRRTVKPKKDDSIAIRVSPDIKKKLQEIAKSEMRSLSNLITKILTEYLKP
jgi:predicted transcriptional regulator